MGFCQAAKSSRGAGECVVHGNQLSCCSVESSCCCCLFMAPRYTATTTELMTWARDMGSSYCDNAVEVTPQGSQGKRQRELVGPKCYGKIMRRRQRPGVFMAPSARGAWSRSALMSLARRSLATTHFAVPNNSDRAGSREQGGGRSECYNL